MAEDDDPCATVMHLLAHDVRNPLTAVQLNAQLIERAAAEAGREKEQRWAALVVGAARRLDGLVGQLVEAERLRLGRMQLKREAVAWNQFLRDLLAEENTAFDPRRVRLTLPEAPVAVTGDRDRLGRAVRGLLCLVMEQADGSATVAVAVEARKGKLLSSIRAPRSSAARAAGKSSTGTDPAAASGIALHFARTILRCHGGALRPSDGDPDTIGFELVLPMSAAT